MTLTPAELLSLAGGVLLLALLLFLVVARALARWRGTRVRARGLGGERAAEKLLLRQGYRVLSHQIEGEAHVLIDGRRHSVTVRADLLVEKGGERFSVEVKTGQGRRATVDTTRRQLLEYALVFPQQRLLLVDADAGEVHQIAFSYPRPSSEE